MNDTSEEDRKGNCYFVGYLEEKPNGDLLVKCDDYDPENRRSRRIEIVLPARIYAEIKRHVRREGEFN